MTSTNLVTVVHETTATTTTTVARLDGTAAEQAIAVFEAAKKSIKAAEEAKAQAEAILRDLMGDATVGTIAGVERVKIASRTRTGTDRETLRTAFPEAYEQTLTTTDYSFVQVVPLT